MPSLTVENYLKGILQISLREEHDWVATGQLAAELSVSPGTVTSMLKALAESGLADYRPYEGVSLTKSGRMLALRMLRRHRLIELFLVETLGLGWDQVHEEAENMEHAVSDFLIDRIDEYLGRPECDPHGDPIPTADGKMRSVQSSAIPLSQAAAGTTIKFVRVTNQGPEFLRYLSEAGIEVGSTGLVEENNAEAGIVRARLADHTVSLGHSAADKLLVEKVKR